MADPAGFDSRRDALVAWLRGVLPAPAFEIEPASEDASFRRYFRVRIGARTWVAMDAPPPMEDCRAFVSVLALLREAGVNAPALHAAEMAQGFLLLDDLGACPYLDVLDEDSADGLYADAIDTLLAMQSRIDPDRVPPYDERRLREELALFRQWFLARHLGVELDGALSRALDDTFEALIRACREQPQVFVHRDYHSRNLMRVDRNNPGVIDFQDAVHGPIAYDLASLLRDVYVDWPEDRVDGWVEAYRRRAVARGLIDADRAQFRRWFDLTGVQRHLKIAGIFARLWHRDRKPRYLDDLPRTLACLAEVSPRHPETEAVVQVLEELDVASRVSALREGIAPDPRRRRHA